MLDADFKRFAKCPKMSVFKKQDNIFKLLTFSTVYSVCCFFAIHWRPSGMVGRHVRLEAV